MGSLTLEKGTSSAAVAAVIRVMLVDDHAVVRAGAIDACWNSSPAFRWWPRLMAATVPTPCSSSTNPTWWCWTCPCRASAWPGDHPQNNQPRSRKLASWVFSIHDDAMLAERAVQLGARGSFIAKSNAPEVVATAVGEVAAGQLYLSSDIANSIAILETDQAMKTSRCGCSAPGSSKSSG